MKSKTIIGQVLVILSGCLWGCMGIFTRKLTAYGISSYQIGFIRSISTVILLLAVMLVKNRKLLKFHLKDVWIFAGAGIIGFSLLNITYMTSIIENSLSVACALMYTSPIWVMLISRVVFKEKLNVVKVVSILACFVGCVAICLSSTIKMTWFGLIIGIASGLTYASYSIFGKIASKKYSPFTVTFYAFVFASLVLLPICNVGNLVSNIAKNTESLWYVVGIGFLETFLPFLLYTIGLSLIDASKAAVFAIIDPVVATIVGAIAFSESIGAFNYLGMFIVLVGLISQNKENQIMKRLTARRNAKIKRT